MRCKYDAAARRRRADWRYLAVRNSQWIRRAGARAFISLTLRQFGTFRAMHDTFQTIGWIQMNRAPRPSRVALITGIVYLVLGLVLAAGGIRLITLGGSWYYLLAGVAVAVSGVLLCMRKTAALWLYALMLLATTVWAVVEVGLDFWQLLPRIMVWFVLGLWLLVPWVRNAVGTVPPVEGSSRAYVVASGRRRADGRPLGIALLIALVVGLISVFMSPHDHAGELTMGGGAETAAPAGVNPVKGDWVDYGGSGFGQRYSPLAQITPDTAPRLKLAWSIQTGDRAGPDDPTETTDENTPIKVGNMLYLCTPHSKVIAVDPATGQEKWRFDPAVKTPVGTFKHWEHMTCRGVSYHDDARYSGSATPAGTQPASDAPATGATGGVCPRRVFLPTADARLIALNADTGKPCTDFGNRGTIDLRANIGPFTPGGYYSTSPPAVTRNLVIISGHVTDNESTNEPSGVIRAFDVHDGHLVWNWDAGNPDETAPLPPGHTYVRNSPNMWSVFSVDESLGMLYAPLGNQTPDQWGGLRTPNSERFAAGVVALDLNTGKVRWNYQFTHHDLWDMDVGGQPTLVDIQTAEGVKPALLASTKQGSIYTLDRRTGQPIYPITEMPVPQGAAQGDRTSPTQPVSALNFNPPRIVEANMWGTTPFDQLWCRINFRSMRYDGPFTPPSTQGTLVFPGNFGVFDWGGVAVDPVRQVMVVNPSYMAFRSKLVPRAEIPTGTGERKGSETSGIKLARGAPFGFELSPMLSPLGIPCQAPPWGYVAGVDLKTGKVAWQHKNGTIRDSAPLPIPMPLGVPSLGGMTITAGGVAFLSGTLDYYLRAYDVSNGKEIWKARLPAGGQATPMSYADANGKQYVVVAAGGHGSLGTKQGDYVVAYTLP
jgi:quinoprotein glucose dehydrogenase